LGRGGGQNEKLSALLPYCKRAVDLSSLSFCSDGSVSACCFDFNRKLILGNIMYDSFENIIKSEKTKLFKSLHKKATDVLKSDLICKDCDQIYDRKDVLIYSSDKNFHVGEISCTKRRFKKDAPPPA
jgi:radical SAM protein with 4Fe4S-binding SPASM domain